MRHLISLAAILSLLSLIRGYSAILDCHQKIEPSSLGGKTIWLTIEAGQAPFESTGSYRIDLKPDGTFSVPAAPGIAARTGTWSALRPSEALIVRIYEFHNDTIQDVLALFDNCSSCIDCKYSFHREGQPVGAQSGSFVVTDGEAPPPAPASLGLRGIGGGGTYQYGANVSLIPDIVYTGNPSSYRFQWFKEGVKLTSMIPGFLGLNQVTVADSGVYTVVVSRGGITNTAGTTIAVQNESTPASYLGRNWIRLIDGEPNFNPNRPPFRVNRRADSSGFWRVVE